MSRRARLILMSGGLAVFGLLIVLAFVQLPSFGHTSHPYRSAAVPVAVSHVTANVVSSVNFDQRGLDTLGEETIFFASIIGAISLLRPSEEEREAGPSASGQALGITRVLGYGVLPAALVIGADVVTQGHLTPGGGFQGGVVLASGLHLLYVSGSYQALARLRPVALFDYGEALGAATFVGLGIAGVVAVSAFLANWFADGQFGQLLSAGTVPLLNGAVGLAVGCGVVTLLAKFLDQAILLGAEHR